jgi:hypothetical protein
MSGDARAAIEVYLEVGTKRTFAGALEWPGWCRAGRDEAAALQALVHHGPRYAAVLRSAGIPFPGVPDAADLVVVERLAGDATTDFGAPGKAPSADVRPLDEPDLARLRAVLAACWAAFDRESDRASGKELRRGPRGGGRDLESIVQHVLAAEGGYLSKLGRKAPAIDRVPAADGTSSPSRRAPVADAAPERAMVLDAIDAAAHGTTAPRGPRGGSRWSARYAVRRMAWHVLDHAWEIEDRAIP